MGKTFAEKVLGRAAGCEVRSGDIVTVYPDFCLSHENTSAIAATFRTIGVEHVYDPDRIVVVFDHTVPPPTGEYANSQKKTREFIREQGIGHFYDMNNCGGICHQILCQEGYAAPGLIIVGADSHTCTHGAMGAFATGIGRSEMAAVWATGKLWLRVPESMKIEVEGSFPPGVTAKDFILTVAGDITASGADYLSIEFHGSAIEAMSLGERMTICNMAVEMGAKTAYMQPNEDVLRYVEEHAVFPYEVQYTDPDFQYAESYVFDVSSMEPELACPSSVENVHTLRSVIAEGEVRLNQGYIGSCTGGRDEDIAIAAKILKGKHIPPYTRLIIVPASAQVLQRCLEKGYIQDLIQAGATLAAPGCAACLGVHEGILAPGEVCITSTNRNFPGRMGSKEAKLYLASPAAVAASILNGRITDPTPYL